MDKYTMHRCRESGESYKTIQYQGDPGLVSRIMDSFPDWGLDSVTKDLEITRGLRSRLGLALLKSGTWVVLGWGQDGIGVFDPEEFSRIFTPAFQGDWNPWKPMQEGCG